jgi:hypothetical protein
LTALAEVDHIVASDDSVRSHGQYVQRTLERLLDGMTSGRPTEIARQMRDQRTSDEINRMFARRTGPPVPGGT